MLQLLGSLKARVAAEKGKVETIKLSDKQMVEELANALGEWHGWEPCPNPEGCSACQALKSFENWNQLG
jgi:hypothetical protein